jgi:5-formyltetrahydrofolate cyclo-ligase
MTKKELRTLYKQKRSEISSKEKLKLDDLMLLQLQQLNFSGIHSLLTYWPMANHQEPNTHLFSGYLRHMLYDLQIAYPVTNFTSHSMQAHVINEDTVYVKHNNGITEPKDGEIIQPHNIDLVFVPLLICDRFGYRVGYGKGFYDRFLAQCSESTVTIGFNYFDPIEEISDTNEFDIPLNYCITPHQIFDF